MLSVEGKKNFPRLPAQHHEDGPFPSSLTIRLFQDFAHNQLNDLAQNA